MPSSLLDNVAVVLVSPRNPLNIGAAARAMSNFGLRNLRVVNPYDIAFREARSAVGASQLLADATEFTSVADAVADRTMIVGTTGLRKRELQHPLRDLAPGMQLIRKQMSSRIALLFGSEKRGLSNEDLSYCHWLLRIPTQEQHPSMNLGQAVAVCLYELTRRPVERTRSKKDARVDGQNSERLLASLLYILNSSGYLNPSSHKAAEEKFRRLLRRLELSTEDTLTLLGMFRQISWKIGIAED